MNLLTDREYLGLTIPFMLSTMTQPLMGAVNTAVMGQLPDPKYIAAVSLGAILFNNLYWLFGFLRVSTTGYAAQAFGAADKRLGMLAFFKPLVLAMLISACCILFQKPILELYLAMIGAAPEVNELCRDYYYILIWGAPLVFGNYVALGWLMGQTRVRASVFMQVSMNVLNMALSIWFVFWLHMDITGVAFATLLSQLYGGILSIVLMYYYGDFDYKALPWSELLDWREFIGMLQVNVNLMIRTACLLTVNNIIAAVGASFGTVVLAANAVLLQLKDIMSYLIDGMANGAAIFSGRAELPLYAEATQADAKKVGIKVNLKNVDYNVLDGIGRKGDYDLLISNVLTLQAGDPEVFMNMYLKTGQEQNGSGYSNPKFDALSDKLGVEFDPAKRRELVIEMQKVILDDAASLVFGHPQTNMVSNKSIANAEILPCDYYWLTKDIKSAN